MEQADIDFQNFKSSVIFWNTQKAVLDLSREDT
jgi:hypothetical protein